MSKVSAVIEDQPVFLDVDDVAPEDRDVVKPKADPTCQECGEPLPWKGTGFRPKYCALHKPLRGPKGDKESKSEDTRRKPGRPANSVAVDRAISSLEMLYGTVGTGLRLSIAPNVGSALVGHREELAESYRMLLETNKAVRDWFSKAEEKAAWLPILVVHGDLIAQVLMAKQFGRMSAEEAEAVADQVAQDGLWGNAPAA